MNLLHLPKEELHLHLDCGLSYDVVSTFIPEKAKLYLLRK